MSKLGCILAKFNLISFYLYLKGSKNNRISESLNEMEMSNSEWFKCANKLISDHITNLDQYKYCNNKQKGEKDGKVSHETEKKQLKLKLQKEKYTFEKYLDFIDNRQHKTALTK